MELRHALIATGMAAAFAAPMAAEAQAPSQEDFDASATNAINTFESGGSTISPNLKNVAETVVASAVDPQDAEVVNTRISVRELVGPTANSLKPATKYHFIAGGEAVNKTVHLKLNRKMPGCDTHEQDVRYVETSKDGSMKKVHHYISDPAPKGKGC